MSKTGQELWDELFALVQGDQGQAFIADGLPPQFANRRDVLRITRISLRFTERTARKLRKFLKDHA